MRQLCQAYVASYPSGLYDRLCVLKRKLSFSLHTVASMISAASRRQVLSSVQPNNLNWERVELERGHKCSSCYSIL